MIFNFSSTVVPPAVALIGTYFSPYFFSRTTAAALRKRAARWAFVSSAGRRAARGAVAPFRAFMAARAGAGVLLLLSAALLPPLLPRVLAGLGIVPDPRQIERFSPEAAALFLTEAGA